MRLLLVSLYEFGQFLQIVLWIALPMAVLSVLITTYLHYRKRRKLTDPVQEITETRSAMVEEGENLVREGENAYKGLLWMKTRYEQDREQAEKKYAALQQELRHSEDRYSELQGVYLQTRELLIRIQQELNSSTMVPVHGSGPVSGQQDLPTVSLQQDAPAITEAKIVSWMESSSA